MTTTVTLSFLDLVVAGAIAGLVQAAVLGAVLAVLSARDGGGPSSR